MSSSAADPSAIPPPPQPPQPRKSALSPKSGRRTASPKPDGGGMRKNRISFGDNQMLVFEKDIHNDDEDAKNAVWYSKKEMKTIRKDLKKSIKKGDISRGLETYAGDMGAENKSKRINHMKSILALQNAQKECGINDAIGLQSLSRSLSADNLRKARQLASLDSTQAFEEYQEILQLNSMGLAGTSGTSSSTAHHRNNEDHVLTSSGAIAAGKNATFDTKPMGSLRKLRAASKTAKNVTTSGGSSGLRRSQKSTPNMFLSGLSSNKKTSTTGLAALRKQLIPSTTSDKEAEC